MSDKEKSVFANRVDDRANGISKQREEEFQENELRKEAMKNNPIVLEMAEIANSQELKEAISYYVKLFGGPIPAHINIKENHGSYSPGIVVIEAPLLPPKWRVVGEDQELFYPALKILIKYREKEEKREPYMGGKNWRDPGVDAKAGIGIQIIEPEAHKDKVLYSLEDLIEFLVDLCAKKVAK